MTALQEIITHAKQELKERFSNEQYPEDTVHEISDSYVPIYNYELMELTSDPEIFYHENELPPAFNGEVTLSNITATAVYELISEALFEYLYELQEGAT